MPFTIADKREGAYQARSFTHVVVDTEARPGSADFEALAKGCDLLVVPTVPAALDTHVLILTLAAVRKLAPDKYRVLLTKVPPAPESEGQQLREELKRQAIPVLRVDIPRLKSFEKAATDAGLCSPPRPTRQAGVGSLRVSRKGNDQWEKVNLLTSFRTARHIARRKNRQRGELKTPNSRARKSARPPASQAQQP